jgi:NitT/TauT family transport system substrate-binding protein
MGEGKKMHSGLSKTVLLTSAALALVVLFATAVKAGDTVNLRFSWKLKGEYAPLFVAREKGYFAEQGLDVVLSEGAGPTAAFASLIKGADQISWMPGIYSMQATSQGMPLKIIALYNDSAPLVIVSWPEKPIRTPADLMGKKIAMSAGETGAVFMPILCEKNQIDCSKIQFVHLASGATVPAFIAHQVDAVPVYRSNDLPIMKGKYGDVFVEFDETKWGLVAPGSALVATDDYIAQHSDILVKFVRAANLGFEFCKKEPFEAANLMLKKWQASLSPEIVAEQIKGLTGAATHYPGKPVGYVSPDVISEGLRELKVAGQIETVKATDLYYTNQIVDKVGSVATAR